MPKPRSRLDGTTPSRTGAAGLPRGVRPDAGSRENDRRHRALSEAGDLRQRLVRDAHDLLGVDVELLVDVGELAGGAEAMPATAARTSAVTSALRKP